MVIYRCDLTLHDILLEACDYVVSRQLTIACQRSIKVRAIMVCYSAFADSGALSGGCLLCAADQTSAPTQT